MAHMHFTSWLRELVPNGPLQADGTTVREALAAVLGEAPQLRSYVLDEQGRLRKHVCIFADGHRLARDTALDYRIGPQTELYVMQALSGG